MTTLVNQMWTGSRNDKQLPHGSAPDDGSLVKIEDLCVSFTRGGSKVRAVRGVSLEIGPGEIVGLVGESG